MQYVKDVSDMDSCSEDDEDSNSESGSDQDDESGSENGGSQFQDVTDPSLKEDE